MTRRSITCACMILVALLALPVTAGAQSNCGSSEIDQYSEQIPSGGGNCSNDSGGSIGGNSNSGDVATSTGAAGVTEGTSGAGSDGAVTGEDSGSGAGGAANGSSSSAAEGASGSDQGSTAGDRAAETSAINAGVVPNNSDDDGGMGTIWILVAVAFVAAGAFYWFRRRRVS